MKKSTAFILSGTGLGLFVGSSMGVATGGTAYNAALFLTPLGAFIGWLLASKSTTLSKDENNETQALPVQNDSVSGGTKKTRGGIEMLVHSAMAIMASVWNFHIEFLRVLGLLPAFVRQPLLFVGFCVVVSAFFPPFFAVYFFAWLGANYFGLSEKGQYRVIVE